MIETIIVTDNMGRWTFKNKTIEQIPQSFLIKYNGGKFEEFTFESLSAAIENRRAQHDALEYTEIIIKELESKLSWKKFQLHLILAMALAAVIVLFGVLAGI